MHNHSSPNEPQRRIMPASASPVQADVKPSVTDVTIEAVFRRNNLKTFLI
jgi:hypothetical protein